MLRFVTSHDMQEQPRTVDTASPDQMYVVLWEIKLGYQHLFCVLFRI